MGDKSKLKIGTYQNPNSGRSKESIDNYVKGMRDKKYGGKKLNTDRVRKIKMLTGGQAKIAAKAPPPNKIDEKDFAVLRAEKAKGRGMGLQDESKKPGKIYKAALGVMAMKKANEKGAKGPELLSPVMLAKRLFKKKAGGVMKYKRGSGLDLPVISSVKPAVHKTKRTQNLSKMKIQFNKQRSRMGDFAKKKGLPKPLNTSANFKGAGKFPYVSKTTTMAEMRKAKGFKPGESATEFNKRRMKLAGAAKAVSATRIGKIALGVGAAGVAAQQYLKSKMNKKKDVKKKMGGGMMKKNQTTGLRPEDKKNQTTGPILMPYDRKNQTTGPILKPRDKMGGGMMKKPMGYNTGGFKSKQDRKKAEKNIKEARSTEGLRSFLSGRTNPMRKDRYMEGRKARHTEFKKKIGKSALGVLGSLIPGAAAAKVAKKVLGRGDKKRDFQKGDYGDISVKKNMGGMMMQRPMGYKHGTSVTAKCKLGRNKPTKIT